LFQGEGELLGLYLDLLVDLRGLLGQDTAEFVDLVRQAVFPGLEILDFLEQAVSVLEDVLTGFYDSLEPL
jgi:hypothetical protein